MPLLETFGNASVRGWRAVANGGGGAFELISTQSISSTTTTVTFSSIPQTYSHLELRIVARSSASTTSDGMYLQYNGVSSASYAYHRLYANGASYISQNTTGDTGALVAFIAGGTSPANAFSSTSLSIADYTNASKNPVVKFQNADINGSSNSVIMFGSGMLPTAGAVTSLSFTMPNLAGGFAAGSRFSLYGVI
jgi:hypothetical protein